MTAAGTPVSHTTVADALKGTRVLSWPRLEALVSYLGGDVAEARALWAQTVAGPDPDPESHVIQVAGAGLLSLEPCARHRVIAYLTARFAGASATACELAGDLAELDDAGALAGIREVVTERLAQARSGSADGVTEPVRLAFDVAQGGNLAWAAALLAAQIDHNAGSPP